jgi:hypothetical protein
VLLVLDKVKSIQDQPILGGSLNFQLPGQSIQQLPVTLKGIPQQGQIIVIVIRRDQLVIGR